MTKSTGSTTKSKKTTTLPTDNDLKDFDDDDNSYFDDSDFSEGIEHSLKKTKAAASGGSTILSEDWLAGLAKALDPDNTEDGETKHLWTPNVGPQHLAFYSDADELFFGGAAGGGKLLSNNNIVATIFGWKKAGDVKVGDQLVAADGTATKVIGVYPHKDIDLYEVTFVDGAKITVGDEHLWMYWYAGKRIEADRNYVLFSPTKGIHYEPVRGRLGTTKDLYKYHKHQEELQKNGKRPYWIITPLCKPVRYTRPSKTKHGDTIRIDPYLLGLLIGDGSIASHHITITTIDQFIVDEVRRIYGENAKWDEDKTIRLNGNIDLRNKLESYGLFGKTSINKFIPEHYLYANVETRLNLLQGMIDTDGYIDDRGHISYTTISEQLSKDVQQLARSLGAKATITKNPAGYKDKSGVYIPCNDAYDIWIQSDDNSQFARMPRKKDRIKSFNGGVSEAGRRIVSIEPVGKGDGVCFAIDHPSGLHVVQDFIVTHNSDLMLGLALSDLSPHRKAIIFRRSYPELKDIVVRARQILEKTDAKFRGGNAMRFDGLPYGKSLELGSVPNFAAAQKYKGRPHDLKLFDELPDVPENVYTFLIGWARTAEEGIPVRVVAAGNPPTNADGEWVIRRWAAWIDKSHPNPAKPGELRWFATLDGNDMEITEDISVEGSQGNPFEYITRENKAEIIKPKSRTFIPATLDDNPYLADTDYKSILQNMPEPYRSQLLYGDFGVTQKEDIWQVIPTHWVRLAQQRWLDAFNKGEIDKLDQSAVAYGLDVAEGGKDYTVLVKMAGRAVQWIEYIKEPDTMKQADMVEIRMIKTKRSPIAVDAIGVGLGLSQRLRQKGMTVIPVKVSNVSAHKDATGTFEFMNLRSELWWRMREALDPTGSNPIMIPNDKRLFGELITPRYDVTSTGKIKIQSQDEIKAKIGRSPDTANGLMLALYVAQKRATPMRII